MLFDQCPQTCKPDHPTWYASILQSTTAECRLTPQSGRCPRPPLRPVRFQFHPRTARLHLSWTTAPAHKWRRTNQINHAMPIWIWCGARRGNGGGDGSTDPAPLLLSFAYMMLSFTKSLSSTVGSLGSPSAPSSSIVPVERETDTPWHFGIWAEHIAVA